MVSTSQLFNLTPQERIAAINTVAREAYQGGGGADIAAVTANLLSRRLANYGGNSNLVDIVKQPGQYAVNFHLNREQVTNPNLLSESDYKRVADVFDNPSRIKDAYQKSGGALSFRGVDRYDKRKPGDYVPVEGKSNFYFDRLDQATYQKGLETFASVPESSNNTVQDSNAFLKGYKGNVTTQIPDGYSGAVTVNNYYGDGTETQQKKNKNLTQTLFTSLLNQKNKSSDPLDLLLKRMSLGGPGSGKLYPLFSLPIFNQLN
jgi:hypothetical protein